MIEETKSAWESGDWAMDIKKIKVELLARRKALVELAEEAEGARQP
ncbi:MAG: hypothetical protein HOA58_01155, partial [Rhodospirillaceae bacterium]|nr:hypothetical protein [Rhodospirillaceae bacterium]